MRTTIFKQKVVPCVGLIITSSQSHVNSNTTSASSEAVVLEVVVAVFVAVVAVVAAVFAAVFIAAAVVFGRTSLERRSSLEGMPTPAKAGKSV
jgi:uncharacterized membrane protein